MRLPVWLHGWGFQSMEESCGSVFLETLETAFPFMTGRDGVCLSWGSCGEELRAGAVLQTRGTSGAGPLLLGR